MSKTQADQWLDVIRQAVEDLDDALEIDNYRGIFRCIRIIKGHLERIEDGAIDYLTAGQAEALKG